MTAHGTRERIIEQNRYRPVDEKKAERPRKFMLGMERTMKKKGDIVLVNDSVKPYKVTNSGWF